LPPLSYSFPQSSFHDSPRFFHPCFSFHIFVFFSPWFLFFPFFFPPEGSFSFFPLFDALEKAVSPRLFYVFFRSSLFRAFFELFPLPLLPPSGEVPYLLNLFTPFSPLFPPPLAFFSSIFLLFSRVTFFLPGLPFALLEFTSHPPPLPTSVENRCFSLFPAVLPLPPLSVFFVCVPPFFPPPTSSFIPLGTIGHFSRLASFFFSHRRFYSENLFALAPAF